MAEAYLCGHALTPDEPVQLWKGAWRSGDLLVTKTGGNSGCTGLGDISDYKFLIVVWYKSVLILCRNIEKGSDGDEITGGTVRYGDKYGAGMQRTFAVKFYRTGNVLSCDGTLPPLMYTEDNGSYWAKNQPITEIWGLGKVSN